MDAFYGEIVDLEKDQVFVFGSNQKGMHLGGAAAKAMEFGAVVGKHVGYYGQTYAIPTCKSPGGEKVTKKELEGYIKDFIGFVKGNQHLLFLITRIGCGIAGWEPEEVAPLFSPLIEENNVLIDEEFYNILIKEVA